MSEPTLEDGILQTCNICNEQFDNLVNFTEHSKMHVNMEMNNKKQTTTRKRRKKKRVIKYCRICCKSFASAASCFNHMKHFHETSTESEYDVIFKNNRLTSTHEDIEETNQTSSKKVCIEEIFREFEKKLPFEFKYDICICSLCDGIIFENMQDFLNHEKIHYQVVEVQMQVQVPVQVQVPMPISVPMPVQVQVSMPISVPMPVEVQVSVPISAPMPVQSKLPTDESTSSTDNNDVFVNFICNICGCTFATELDLDEHMNTNCEDVEQITPIGDTANIRTEHQLLGNPSDFVVIEKSSSLNMHSEEHINACKELFEVKQQFYCDICQKTCERSDHFEVNQWWTASTNHHHPFKCRHCSETFSEKVALKLHETEHFKKNRC